MKNFFKISDEVQTAIAENKPVVSLESTIISHGFPYPDNLECANKCEDIIRENGAVPATIGIIDGIVTVGLNKMQIEEMATKKDIIKTSRRDIPYIISKKLYGATTVASTMIFSHMAGIKIFATGGIGGVHRQNPLNFDISADLQEFKTTNVAVVCAGAKSILQIPMTREYLETLGVLVCGYQTWDFPSFYTRSSGTKVDVFMEDEHDVAKFLLTKEKLGFTEGTIIANPIPEADALDESYISGIIDEAVNEARKQNVVGKDETPFLLSYLYKRTGGITAKANKALVFNNCLVAAKIANAYCKLK